MNINASRRDLLKGSGALGVSCSIAPVGDAFAQGAAPAKPVALTDLDSFLAIDARGQVMVYSGKVDLGTGVATALRQIVAEELDVPFSRIALLQGDSRLTPDQGKTWGSLTIQVGGMQLRNAAATARGALLEEAAKRLNAKQEDLKVADGVVSAGTKRVSYGQLIGGKNFALKLDHAKPAQAKDPKNHTVVGKSIPRVDIPGKATGRFAYIHDIRVPGMLHGRVVRPPAIGATLQGVDESSVKDVAGLVKVVRQGNFLGVVAQSEWGAITAARKLKAPGRPGRACLSRPSSTTTCAPPRWCRTRSLAMSATPRRRLRPTACARLPRPTTSPSTLTARWGRPARSRSSRTASSPRGRRRRRRTICASSSPRCSACRRTTCIASTSKAPAAMAATAMRMPRLMRRCWRKR